jgi:hypothetical protein
MFASHDKGGKMVRDGALRGINEKEDFRTKIVRLEIMARDLTFQVGSFNGVSFDETCKSGISPIKPDHDKKPSNQENVSISSSNSLHAAPRTNRPNRVLRFEGEELDHPGPYLEHSAAHTHMSSLPSSVYPSSGTSPRSPPKRPEGWHSPFGDETGLGWSESVRASSAPTHPSPRPPKVSSAYRPPPSGPQPAGTRTWLRRSGNQHRPAEAATVDADTAAFAAHNRVCIVFASTEEPRHPPPPPK